MPVRIIADPVHDPQWSALVERHPAASVFHSQGWLSALQRTYGYDCFVVSGSPAGALDSGVVACRVPGWASRRLVSLPFSDHCNPLAEQAADLSDMLAYLMQDANTNGASLELRPQSFDGSSFDAAAVASGLKHGATYCLHRLDLRRESGEIFRRFHHSTQRAVRRAEREQLAYQSGRSDRMLDSFYRLLRMTRRRHGLPPQPAAWFRNLVACLGDRVSIHMASKDAEPIASMLTLSFKQVVYYKYGGSDAAHHRLGGMPFLFWQVIQDACARGFDELDLGRSDLDQPGLIAFKDHLGAKQSPLTYYNFPGPRRAAQHGWMSRAARGTLAVLPDAALDLAGKLIYKRLG